jgi:tetratricopeptide (TPR) repeat protein
MDAEEEELEQEDYLVLASKFKEAGNLAFKEGNNNEAIDLYTKAIDLNPDDHVYYSNRSAAHMKMSNISKALKDAQRCVELQPEWSKGYNRLGVAQQGLKRFEQAAASFNKGLELEPESKVLKEALCACEELQIADRLARHAKAAEERKAEETRLQAADLAKERSRTAAADADAALAAGGCDLLGSFFADLQPATAPPAPAAAAEEELMASFFSSVKESAVVTTNADGSSNSADGEAGAATKETSRGNFKGDFHDKYANQALGTGAEQHARLTQRNHEFRNLNPFFVLQLDIDATEEDIKQRYRKLSSKVHPDKNRDIPDARDSFEAVKAAYQRLEEEGQREMLARNIDIVREEAKRVYKAKNKLPKDATKVAAGGTVEEAETKAVMKYFADVEMGRRRAEALERSYNAREKMQAQEELDKMKKDAARDKSWAAGDRREKRVANWRDFAESGPAGKKGKSA